MTRAYLGLGSNVGDRFAHLQHALDALAEAPQTRVVAVSSVYETHPVGGPEQGPFLNAVVMIDTEASARELLAVGQAIEQAAQRVRAERWGPRTLDVDLLLYDELTIDEPDLMVPHPRMWERHFVLAPLHDVAPALVAVPTAGWEGVNRTALRLRLS